MKLNQLKLKKKSKKQFILTIKINIKKDICIFYNGY